MNMILDGAKIRRTRILKGMTQATLSKKAGVHQVAISAMERGVIRQGNPETIQRVAYVLGLPMEEMWIEKHTEVA